MPKALPPRSFGNVDARLKALADEIGKRKGAGWARAIRWSPAEAVILKWDRGDSDGAWAWLCAVFGFQADNWRDKAQILTTFYEIRDGLTSERFGEIGKPIGWFLIAVQRELRRQRREEQSGSGRMWRRTDAVGNALDVIGEDENCSPELEVLDRLYALEFLEELSGALTPTGLDTVRALLQTDTLEDAAELLGVTCNSLYARTHRLKKNPSLRKKLGKR